MDIKNKLALFFKDQANNGKVTLCSTRPLATVIDGRECCNDYGTFFLIEKEYRLDEIHTLYPLGEAQKVDPWFVSFWGSNSCREAFNINRAVFLDTETTGLAGGTGTYVFLVGCGYFRADKFVLVQLLMRDYDEEEALLFHLQSLLATKDWLITFNGKTFDWPLLRTRFILAGLEGGNGIFKGHLDLLHPARRLWKEKISSCRLANLERRILKFFRVGDIPGSLIPQRYFDFLQKGDPLLLKDILQHNALDVLSMVSLLTKMHKLIQCEAGECRCPWENMALGKKYEDKKEFQRAREFYEEALKCSSGVKSGTIALARLAKVCKKIGDWDGEEETLLKLLSIRPGVNFKPYIELAKLYEHKRKDFFKARSWVQRGLANALKEGPEALWAINDLDYRLARLERKINNLTL